MFSTLPAVCMAILVIFEKSQYNLAYVVSILLFWILLSVFISSIAIIIFGIPIVKLLSKLNFINIYSLIVSGIIISFILLLFFNNGINGYIEIDVIFITTGIFGGYGFWYGMRK